MGAHAQPSVKDKGTFWPRQIAPEQGCSLPPPHCSPALSTRTHTLTHWLPKHAVPPPPSVVTREQRPRRGRSVPSGGSQLSRWPNPYQRSTWLHCQLPIRLVKKRKSCFYFIFFSWMRAFIRALHDPPTSRYSSTATKSRQCKETK